MLDHEPIFGKNVIETLSEGMYDNSLFLFREYVQNAADAIDMAMRQGVLKEGEGQIEVSIDADERLIVFEDNGTGLAHATVKSMLANIGDSQKDRKTDKGFRGIGRLGGLGYCQRVRFETSALGEPVKSILEWDARRLHDVLSDKDEKMHAGQLIKWITSTREEPCSSEEHFFKVSLININRESDELLDVETVRKYLSMVAPVSFDYERFPFIERIEQFIKAERLPRMHEYRLFLNDDEVRKGYETPLALGDGKTIEVLDVVCRTVRSQGNLVCWYWYCVSKFEGVLPKRCWQRNIRLRKANIQIGEADCLSNHPKRGDTLWREDRGNNYFLGEIHALNEDLIPNSRRDYFNQDDACRSFEAALQYEFRTLHDLYHDASAIRSAYGTVREAAELQTEFERKDKRGEFFDKAYRAKEQQKVEEVVRKAEEARRRIKKYEERTSEPILAVAIGASDGYGASPTAIVFNSYKETDPGDKLPFEPTVRPAKGYAKDSIRKHDREVLDMVFEVLSKMLPEEQAAPIREAITKRFIRR
jgi:hypothetical protein